MVRIFLVEVGKTFLQNPWPFDPGAYIWMELCGPHWILFLMISPTSLKFQGQYSWTLYSILPRCDVWNSHDSWYDGCNVWMQSRCWVYFRSWRVKFESLVQTYCKSPSRIDWSLTHPQKKHLRCYLPTKKNHPKTINSNNQSRFHDLNHLPTVEPQKYMASFNHWTRQAFEVPERSEICATPRLFIFVRQARGFKWVANGG